MLRVAITVAADDLETAYDALLPLIPGGILERPGDDGAVRLYWSGGPETREDLPPGLPAVAFEARPAEEGWAQQLGAVYRFGDRLLLRSSDAPPAPPGVAEVVIDEHDQGFGTGSHPTTRACLELLLDVPAGTAFADLGCGSGVLAIAAVKLGFGPVLAVDREPSALESTIRNARANRTPMEVGEGDLLQVSPPQATAIAANVPLAVHRHIARGLPPGVEHLIASGLDASQADEAAAAYAGAGLTERRRIVSGGWASLLLAR